LPFMFVFNPILLNQGAWYEVLYAVITAIAGIYCLSCVTENFFVKWNIQIYQRAMLAGAALCLIQPGIMTDLMGAILVSAVFLMCRVKASGKTIN